MLARIVSALVFALVTFLFGAAVIVIVKILDPWTMPLLAVTALVGIGVFVLETVWAWLSSAPEE